jgi:hypothetical protein
MVTMVRIIRAYSYSRIQMFSYNILS